MNVLFKSEKTARRDAVAPGKPAPRTWDPTGNISWLAESPGSNRFRWPFNAFQSLLLLMTLVLALWVTWVLLAPSLPATAWDYPIYLIHDRLLLPIKGGVFDRFWPVPQITLFLLAIVGSLVLFFRGFAAEIYRMAVAASLRLPATRAMLVSWVRFRRKDGFLTAEAEAVYRREFDAWQVAPSEAKAKRLVTLGLAVLRMIRAATNRNCKDARMAVLLEIAARQLLVSRRLKANAEPALLRMLRVWDHTKNPQFALLFAGASKTTPMTQFLSDLRTVWALVGDAKDQTLFAWRDALLWCAAVASQTRGDATPLSMLHNMLAEEIFRHQINDGKTASSHRFSDPSLFEIGLTGIQASSSFGLLMSHEDLCSMRRLVEPE